MLFRYLWLRNWSFAGLASIWLVGVVVLVCTLEFDLPLPMFIVGAVIVFLLPIYWAYDKLRARVERIQDERATRDREVDAEAS